MSALGDLFDQIARARGCDRCNADTTLIEEAPGMYVLRIAHDNDCPIYRAKKAAMN